MEPEKSRNVRRNEKDRARYASLSDSARVEVLLRRSRRRALNCDVVPAVPTVIIPPSDLLDDVPTSSGSLVADVVGCVPSLSVTASVVSPVNISDGVVLPASVALTPREKARLRYANMDPVDKSNFLSRRRAQYALRRNPLQAVHLSLPSAVGVSGLGAVQIDVHDDVSLSSGVLRRCRRFERISVVPLTVWALPQRDSCVFCCALKFFREPPGFCCCSGQVVLAPTVACPILWFLYTDVTSEVACEFRRKNRSYNHAFAFTSIGMTIHPDSWWARDGIYALRVLGKVTHFFNPIDGTPNLSGLLQLFFLDTAEDLSDDVLGNRDLRRDVMSLLIQALSDNPYGKFFRRLRSWENLSDARIVIRTTPVLEQKNFNIPTVDEVAGVWKDGDEDVSGCERDIRVYTEEGRTHKVNYYYSCYNPLQYPILFPHGEPGWHPGIAKVVLRRDASSRKRKDLCPNASVVDLGNIGSAARILATEEEALVINQRSRGNVSCREYSCYQAQIRLNDYSILLHAGRLGHEYIIDMYIKLETSRLDYYRSEQVQKELRTESYQGVIDSVYIHGQNAPSSIGQRVILPSSFIGGPRDMRKRYVNAMALVQKFGKPDLFLTMTCNPAWKEIADNLLPCQKVHDRPDLVARVFRAKLEELKDEIVKKRIFGEVAAYVYTIEFQKRGLPHAHWVIILAARHKIISPTVYDQIISAELPDGSHPLLRALVVKHMMHGPCGNHNPKNVCMRDGQCKNHYPKDFAASTINGANSYAIYRRRDDGRSVYIKGARLDNRWVIPYNPYLLVKFDCHINVEICADIKLVKYLYKYIHKGHDKVAYHVVSVTESEQRDEIQSYQDGRWICAPEAIWRIFAFSMSEIHPPVIIMPVHLPNYQPIRFGVQQNLMQVVTNPLSGKTMLTEFFSMNYSDADAKRLNLLYKEFPEFFVWESINRKWKLRKKLAVVGRLTAVNPLEGERYFERLLLSSVRCPVSFGDLMTVACHKFSTFREAAVRRGLLQSDEYVDGCLAEASLYEMPYSLRVLFAMLLVYGIIGDPQALWDKYYPALSEDFVRHVSFSDTYVLRRTVEAIETVLTSMDKSFVDFPIRLPSECSPGGDRHSRDYDNECSMQVSNEDMLSIGRLNACQKTVFDTIVSKINCGGSGVFFLDGPGGTGKTFLYRALLAYVRSRGGIALPVATSGVAASLLPGGRTAHSRFKLPFDALDKTNGKISKQTSLAKMIREAKLIIWDEASMANRFSIEALDLTLADICDKSEPFGGKIVLFGGDFRQTLPIVVHGSRDALMEASFVSSKLWEGVTRLRLQDNMRAKEDPLFTSFLLEIGNGEVPYVFGENIRLPSSLIIPFVDVNSSLDQLIDCVYPCMDIFLNDPHSMVSRAILTTKNECVAELNDMLIDRFPGQLKEYVSFNRTNDALQQAEYEDYLSGVTASGLPPHILKLKKNCPIMLLRNLNPIEGLCNGTRLICTELGDNFIGAEISTGDFKGHHVFIPRIPLESSDKLKCPIPFRRMQIPVRPCFAMTVNKSQGQTLDYVGLYLREPVFSHGQLYVGLSRVKSSSSVKVLIHPDSKNDVDVDHTKNIVFKDFLALAWRN
ncbi:hypothetical protein ACJIZ3_001596 [Penstemon smallii]|uniref:ATP-dependent DNA helicase n=1 Tax=Penstemon smallii TaxID=265156 RepID=A0ABD3U6J1_9LAMI